MKAWRGERARLATYANAPWCSGPAEPWPGGPSGSDPPQTPQGRDISEDGEFDPFFDLDRLEEGAGDLMSVTGDDAEKWVRIDFTVDSGAATSCIPAEMVNPRFVRACLEGPRTYTSASNHKVDVKGQMRARMRFQNGIEGEVNLKVLEGLKRPLFSTSKMT